MIMEDQHMTQQVFADFLRQSPATLSSIFNGRTRPTLNIIDAIKMKIPDINVEWLLYGTGDKYVSHSQPAVLGAQEPSSVGQETMIDFDGPTSNVSSSSSAAPSHTFGPLSSPAYSHGVKSTHPEFVREEIKIVDKEPRKVTEIRVYYDDQTYETFVPAKK